MYRGTLFLFHNHDEHYPPDILIKSRIVGFWKRLVCGKQDKISCILYNLMYKLHTGIFYFSKWLNCVESTLNNCGFSEYWIHQNVTVTVVNWRKWLKVD